MGTLDSKKRTTPRTADFAFSTKRNGPLDYASHVRDAIAGTYHLVRMHGANPVGAEATIPVTLGAAASAYMDPTSSAGLASGVITANGQPLAVDRIVGDGGGTTDATLSALPGGQLVRRVAIVK